MTEIRKAHDKFIRDLMSRKEVVRDFLRNYLDKELVELLDLSTLEIKKDTFVDQELGEHFSDILYQLKFRNGQDAKVYVLIEHKSYSDYLVAFQLLRYMVRIWELELKQQEIQRKKDKQDKKDKKNKQDKQDKQKIQKIQKIQKYLKKPSVQKKKLTLSPILPIVFYHGTQEWKVPLGFHDIFLDLPSVLAPYVPDFRYFLYDLTKVGDSEIRGDAILQIGLLSLKYARDEDLKDKLDDIFNLFDQLANPQEVREYLETLVRYLWSTSPISRKEIKTALVEKFNEEGDSIMTTIAETFIEQGRKEMELEVQKAHQEAEKAHREAQKVRQEMIQEVQKAYQEAQKVRQQAQAEKRLGLLSSIEWGLELKFGEEGLGLFNEVQQIQEMSLLSAIRAALKFVRDLGELRSIYQPPLANN